MKVSSATTGDFIKQLRVFDVDPLQKLRNEMAKHFSLPPSSLIFMNQQHCVLSNFDRVSSFASRKISAKSDVNSGPNPQKVMIVEWIPGQQGFNRSTGEHGCRTLACGHLTCTLADVEDGCEECRIVAEKAEKERIAREKAKQARIETSNILLDLEKLRRIKIKSRTVKEILARLAAEAKASSANDKKANEEPKVKSKAGMKKAELKKAEVKKVEMKRATSVPIDTSNTKIDMKSIADTNATKKRKWDGKQAPTPCACEKVGQVSELALEMELERMMDEAGSCNASATNQPSGPQQSPIRVAAGPDSLEMELERMMDEAGSCNASATNQPSGPQQSPICVAAGPDSLEMELERMMDNELERRGHSFT